MDLLNSKIIGILIFLVRVKRRKKKVEKEGEDVMGGIVVRLYRYALLVGTQLALQLSFLKVLVPLTKEFQWLLYLTFILNIIVILSPNISFLGVNASLSTSVIYFLLSLPNFPSEIPVNLVYIVLYIHVHTILIQAVGITF